MKGNFDITKITRKRNIEIENFINNRIKKDETSRWKSVKSNNYGLVFQQAIGDYFTHTKKKFGISKVDVNFNPSDPRPDVVLTMKDGTVLEKEVKSFKDEMLSGLTICNHPNLLKDVPTYVVNYVFNGEKVFARMVIETELHRLTGIAKSGKYCGCLLSTRDNGKKLKGRCFNDFFYSNPDDDKTIEELNNKALILKTELHYTIAKLVPGNYEPLEVVTAYEFQRMFK
jgi:hypothetical protein